jgi:hypothetical protein
MNELVVSKPLMGSTQFADRLNEGGPIMYFILICLLLSLFLIVKAFLKRKSNKTQSNKMIGLAADTGLLGLVIGCLGSVTGLIQLLDLVESIGNIRPDLFSAGLKVSLLTITFGLASFVLVRIGILVFKWTQDADSEKI